MTNHLKWQAAGHWQDIFIFCPTEEMNIKIHSVLSILLYFLGGKDFYKLFMVIY